VADSVQPESPDPDARRLTAALTVAEALANAETVEQALGLACEAVKREIGCPSVTAFVPREGPDGTPEQHVVFDIDDNGSNIQGRSRAWGETLSGIALATGEQAIEGHASRHGLPTWAGYDTWTYESALHTPIAIDGQAVAAIGIYDKGIDAFGPADALLMQAVARHLELVLRGISAAEEAEHRAQRLSELERRQRSLLARLVRAQEDERSRVATDLHDDTIQVLSACVLAVDGVHRRLRNELSAPDRDELTRVSVLLRSAVERTRRMTFSLRPATLSHQGLVAAGRQLLSTVSSETGIETSLESAELSLDPTTESVAFRCLAELVTNARTHAHASRIDVELLQDYERLTVRVADDGNGFDPETALPRALATNHMGLDTVRERLEASGGDLVIDSRPQEGTRVTFSLPFGNDS
jgi:signal transduction histidine kinase